MSEYRKAIIGGAMAGLGALGTALADGHVTTAEWVVIAVAVVGAVAAVYRVPNGPAL